MKIYGSAAELVGNTPLVRLGRIEKKYGLKDGAKVTSGGAPDSSEDETGNEGDKDTPAWARAIINSVKTLSSVPE